MGQTILMVTHEPRGRGYRDPGDLARGWRGYETGGVEVLAPFRMEVYFAPPQTRAFLMVGWMTTT
jgi:hypothetical protein